MIAYCATLYVQRELVQFVAKLLLAERRRRGTPRGSRALTCFWQAVLGLRWFRDRTTCEALARDHGISRATAYRYLDEVIEVLAEQAPDLRHALERAKDEGLSHVILDGKVIPADRCKESAISVKGQVIDLWYSGKAHAHGGNIQAVMAPGAFAAEATLASARGEPAIVWSPLREALIEVMTAAGLVRRMGTNLNQAVTRLNATGQPGDDVIPAAQFCVRVIRRLDKTAEQLRRAIP